MSSVKGDYITTGVSVGNEKLLTIAWPVGKHPWVTGKSLLNIGFPRRQSPVLFGLTTVIEPHYGALAAGTIYKANLNRDPGIARSDTSKLSAASGRRYISLLVPVIVIGPAVLRLQEPIAHPALNVSPTIRTADVSPCTFNGLYIHPTLARVQITNDTAASAPALANRQLAHATNACQASACVTGLGDRRVANRRRPANECDSGG